MIITEQQVGFKQISGNGVCGGKECDSLEKVVERSVDCVENGIW